jgi:hypothetical protein
MSERTVDVVDEVDPVDTLCYCSLSRNVCQDSIGIPDCGRQS